MGYEARLDEVMRGFQQQAVKAAELKAKIAELRGHGRSPDGAVSVTVAPSGAVLGLQLTPAAMRRSHTQLQQEILGAIRQATQQAAATLQETVQPLLGDRAEQFRQAFNAGLPAVEPSGPPPAPPSIPRPGAPVPVNPPEQAAIRRNRQAAPEVEDNDFGGPILR
ncbi:YbaB/EbfC family nucleoid-associated protein [Amycolatopsis rhizosphaerae]|uniref:YbaB/EbfC family nucleoid-associated protein n=1 Tax=Amycolatopsis rhizosphaerae TaxID=2053003 RepID=A0A558CMW2_9PSEU|nr:YbaB/EbfC family nucleoid-associated protein [Amycolatopsis rhizosphaerae]TVT50111.1 YbaB/EbfC family nucleoid-associated protein [Amycolatopsis rhizosphaerae]